MLNVLPHTFTYLINCETKTPHAGVEGMLLSMCGNIILGFVVKVSIYLPASNIKNYHYSHSSPFELGMYEGTKARVVKSSIHLIDLLNFLANGRLLLIGTFIKSNS